MSRLNYRHTLSACAVASVTQAIVCTLAPLLFVTFRQEFGLTMGQLSFLVFLTFGVQLGMDALSTGLVDRIPARVLIVAAHACSAVGLIAMAVLPGRMPPFAALIVAMTLYSVGGGLVEVLSSPIASACPVKNPKTLMSLLHSVFSWGQVIVVLVSTGCFALFGVEHWRWIALLWAALPAFNTVWFALVPLYEIGENRDEAGASMLSGTFFVLLGLMVVTGAAEQSVSQWASAFAEKGLGISKTAGDLAGICLFAAAMGLARTFYGKWGEKIDLLRFMTVSAALCILGYLLTVFAPWPALALAGCCLCGLSVGILWPGTLTLAGQRIQVSAGMYAWLALAGDVGCALGPTAVGLLSQSHGDSLSYGLMFAMAFTAAALVCLLWLRRKRT